MKRIFSIIACSLLAFACSFSLMSCDTDDESTSSSLLTTLASSSSTTSYTEMPTSAPTAPDIPTGTYMFQKYPNILVEINKDSGTCIATKYANYAAYQRVAADSAQDGDIVSTKTGELVWVRNSLLNWVNAYKIIVDDGSTSGLVRYILGSSTSYNAYSITETTSASSISVSMVSDTFKLPTTSSWVYPSDGNYVSSSTVTINSEDKYLYAVVSNSGCNVTFYLDSTVTDPSTLAVYDTVEDLSYDIYSYCLSASKSDWTIRNTGTKFQVKKTDVISDYVNLTAIE